MTENVKNYYKLCRENAGYSQEYSAGNLHIAVRTLSDYENDKATVPDDIVKKMCKLYDTRFLAMWHLKHGELGDFLPDLYQPETIGDMIFSLMIAKDETDASFEAIKIIYRDKKLEECEIPDLKQAIGKAREANKNLTSIIIFAESNIKELYDKSE